MIFELARDFSDALAAMPEAHPKHRMLELLEEAIRRDIHFIARHPTTLFQCMWNTCWWYDCPEAAKHCEMPKGGWPPGGPSWEQPGPKLCELLEAWRKAKRDATPGFFWVRSLRPSPAHLGGALKAILRGHKDQVQSVAYSPDGRCIISGSHDGTVRVWNSNTGAETLCLRGHDDFVWAVGVSPDGQRIVSGSWDKTVRVWDARTGAEIACLRGHEGEVTGVAFSSPDGRLTVSGSDDKTVRVWRSETGQCLQVHDGRGDVSAIAAGPTEFPFRLLSSGWEFIVEGASTG